MARPISDAALEQIELARELSEVLDSDGENIPASQLLDALASTGLKLARLGAGDASDLDDGISIVGEAHFAFLAAKTVAEIEGPGEEERDGDSSHIA